MEKLRKTVLSATIGILIGGTTHKFLYPDFILAIACAIVYTSGVYLLISQPKLLYDDSTNQRTAIMGGVGTGFLLFVSLVGISPTLPLQQSLRVSISLLTFGGMITMWAFGVTYESMSAENAA
ncbi:hypothetical protein [Haladaptatus cibarius]|uniref:hypothetical protein n=1 Tax=Haladaptatus cibarius TaxID=453847 RepID=UPI001184B8A6|nr:hypothetical protein [Haladaptatus cibarius]